MAVLNISVGRVVQDLEAENVLKPKKLSKSLLFNFF